MMDIETFQNKLNEVRQLAAGNGNVLSAQQVKAFFSGMEPNKEQLVQIFKYLKIQGITIEGLELSETASASDSALAARNSGAGASGAEAGEKAYEQDTKKDTPARALTEEEKAYVREYRESLRAETFDGSEAQKLFAALADGDESARAALVQRYLPVAADMAVSMCCDGVALADLIQEANVCLLSSLKLPDIVKKDDAWLRGEIRSGIRLVIEEQSRRHFEDECLVERVKNLDTAVKELTEEEDGEESKFGINDLAIILDMEIEEIEDVLRLTGGISDEQ